MTATIFIGQDGTEIRKQIEINDDYINSLVENANDLDDELMSLAKNADNDEDMRKLKKQALYFRNHLTVVIPEGVTKLNEVDEDKIALYVKKIVFPSTLESLPKIRWGYRLEEIKLPPSIKIIPTDFCKLCFTLKKINLENIEVIHEGAFASTKLKAVNLPLVREIHATTFARSYLERIDLPLVESIGDSAFRECYFLSNATLPKTTHIGESAFQECPKLSIITAPNISVLSESSFRTCESLKEVAFDKLTSVPEFCFSECKNLRRVSFKRVSDIGEHAFHWCTSLLSVDAPNISNIERSAFAYCKSLQTIDIRHVTEVLSETFVNCESLKTVKMENCTRIGFKSFLDCKSLKNIDVSKVISFGEGSFANCKQLQHLEINKNMSGEFDLFYYYDGFKAPENLTVTLWFTTSPVGMRVDFLAQSTTHLRIILEGELADDMKTNPDEVKSRTPFWPEEYALFPSSIVRTITYIRKNGTILHEHLVRKEDQVIVDTVIQSLQGLGLGGIVAETIVANTGIFSSLTPPKRVYNFISKQEEDDFRLTEEELLGIVRKRRGSTDEARAPKRVQLGSDKRGSDSAGDGSAKRRALDTGFRLSHIPASCFKRNTVRNRSNLK